MTNFRNTLIQLHKNLNILREREAKYAGQVPLDLLNQIEDHQQAIALTEQATRGEISKDEWQEVLAPLLIEINIRGRKANVSNITIGDVQGNIIATEIAGRDISIGQKIVNIFTGGSNQQRDLRNREIMLQRVHDFWVKGVLENSLHNEVLIELGMETKPEAVEYPWEMVIQRPDQPIHILPAGTKMIDVFDESGGSLLILGEPGSGKTTMLLELCRQLIDRAKIDPTQLIPVVFNLSSWAEKRLPLAEWLVEELNTKYSIPKTVAHLWIDNNELSLLLDGLDEVVYQHRKACTEVINAFQKHSLIPVAVCGRIADYDELLVKLDLRQAILLQPITPQQIDGYLNEFDTELSTLRSTLKRHDNLLRIAESPLMLSVLILAYQGVTTENLVETNSRTSSYRLVFETYVAQMFKRRGVHAKFNESQTRHRLSWLAKKMTHNLETLFLVERISSNWLDLRSQQMFLIIMQLIYIISLALIFGLFGMISGNVFGQFMKETSTDLNVGLISGIGLGFLGMVVGSLIDQNYEELKERPIIGKPIKILVWLSARIFNKKAPYTVEPVEMLQWSWKEGGKGLLLGSIAGMIIGLLFGLGCEPIYQSLLKPIGWPVTCRRGNLQEILLLMSTLLGVFTGLYRGLNKGTIETTIHPNQGIRQSMRNALVVGFLFGPIIGLLLGSAARGNEDLSVGLSFDLSIMLAFGLLMGLYFGGFAVIKHYILRLVLWHINQFPWNLVPFLDYCTERIFLRRVGGGYIFIHRYLMEYFALLTEEDIERLSAEIEVGRA